jgi:hypothetical protein
MKLIDKPLTHQVNGGYFLADVLVNALVISLGESKSYNEGWIAGKHLSSVKNNIAIGAGLVIGAGAAYITFPGAPQKEKQDN